MSEQQNIEYKQSWHDEYLKTIVGFANAQGGTIYIGKNDNGEIVGVEDHVKLLESLPNKIRDLIGILPQINRFEAAGMYYLEISTIPYSVAISLRGVYYVRAGSTTQELRGNALTEFLLRKSGKTWDDVIEPAANIEDIDTKSIKYFLQVAEETGRLLDTDGLTIPELLDKLRLTEDGKIKRAAIILFGKDPGRFYPNLAVKIGRFSNTNDDILYQEIVEGNLMSMVKSVPDILNKKFFTNKIQFEGFQRVEKGEYPIAALREMILNALVHRDYMGSTVQIRMYDNQFSIWNEGLLPQGLTLESLRHHHPSRPRNPIIADICFKAGYIDAWGRGTLKIINSCREAELPEPDIKEQHGGISVTLFKDKYTIENLQKIGLNERQIKAVLIIKEKGNISNSEYQNHNFITKATATRDLTEMVEKFKILVKSGKTGVGTVYTLKGS
jgi:ATP-dependent DNA helicase RecG